MTLPLTLREKEMKELNRAEVILYIQNDFFFFFFQKYDKLCIYIYNIKY